MSESTTAMTSSASVYSTPGFWERFWRTSGIQFVMFFIIAFVIYGNQPQVGASAESLVAFSQSCRAGRPVVKVERRSPSPTFSHSSEEP
jgi:hypothetical protein